MSSCRPPCGARRPAATPTPTGPCTFRTRPSTRPARPAPTSTSSSTTPAAWTCATAAAFPCCPGHPEQAWTAFTALTRGRVCDQSALTYHKLRNSQGIQWPCTEQAPQGTERLYTDHTFPTRPETCTDYGHDLATGAQNEADEYRAHDPDGRAILKAASYLPPHEETDADHPLQLTTGRKVYHWHTRTKTSRAPELEAAAPDVWVELHPGDAADYGIAEGDLVLVTSRQGTTVEAPAVLTGTRPGVVFLPFHYGYFDQAVPERHTRAANELTRTEWDPVSKQPIYKVTAVRVDKLTDARIARTGRR